LKLDEYVLQLRAGETEVFHNRVGCAPQKQ
jgi:hypothetical protein